MRRYVLGGVAGWIVANTLGFAYQVLRGELGRVEKPPGMVSVVIPSLYEEGLLECVQSLRGQSIVEAYPEFFEFIAVGDPYADSYITPVMQYFDKIVASEYGKLNARHAGILASRGDIIVAVDADCIYPKSWLSNVLKPFKNMDVVAVTCPTIFNPPLYELVANIPKTLFYTVKISGRASAFRREAYFKAGGFNLSIDQLNDWDEVLREEEYRFKERLSRIGKIVFVNAPVYTAFRKPTPQRVAILKKNF